MDIEMGYAQPERLDRLGLPGLCRPRMIERGTRGGELGVLDAVVG